MSSIISIQGSASYDRVPVAPSHSQKNVQNPKLVQDQKKGIDGDSVEISSKGLDLEKKATSETYRGVYEPAKVNDRFRYEIENGMLDKNLRFNALKNRFPSAATIAYSARQNIESYIDQTAGRKSTYTALFKLQYQDAKPNPSRAASNLEAKIQQIRIINQNLDLLK